MGFAYTSGVKRLSSISTTHGAHQTMAVRIQVRDRLFEGYSPANSRAGTRKRSEFGVMVCHGHRWQLQEGGDLIELYRISVLAKALDRSPRVLRTWEKEGRLPPPLFVPQGEACKHWYTEAQVINCHRIFMHRYRSKKYMSDSDEFESFLSDIRKVWYAPSVVVTEEGLIQGVDANVKTA